MRMPWDLGPVFAFESLIAARRRRFYAMRSLYVGLLLAGLALTWGPMDRPMNRPADAAAIGRLFLLTVLAVQLAAVLLAAPAATAGAVCVDKARGTLLHAFTTDLTDREIILGKLGARLAPVLAVLAYGLPVLALGSFLGGIDLIAAIGAEQGDGPGGRRLLHRGAPGLGLGPQAAPGPAAGLRAGRPVSGVRPGAGPLRSVLALLLDRRLFRGRFGPDAHDVVDLRRLPGAGPGVDRGVSDGGDDGPGRIAGPLTSRPRGWLAAPQAGEVEGLAEHRHRPSPAAPAYCT